MVNFLSAWQQCTNNLKLVILSILSDLIFFMSIVYAIFVTWTRISEALYEIQSLMVPKGIDLQSGEDAIKQLVAKQDIFWQHYEVIMTNILIFVVAFLLIWFVFQGFSWYNALKITKKKIKLFQFYKKFAIISIVMMVLFIIFYYIAIQLNVVLAKAPIPIISQSAAAKIIPVFYAIVLYFIFGAVAITDKSFTWNLYKKTVAARWTKTGLAYVFTLIAFILINFILAQLYGRIPTAGFVIIAILAVPIYTYLRVFLIHSFSK